MRIFASAAVVGALFSGCATPRDQPDPVAYYGQVLSGRPGADLRGGRETAAKAAFQSFLSHLSEETVRRDTKRVYAPDVYFNDTLKSVRGSAALTSYFLDTVKNTEEVKVVFTDVARSGNEYYFRWVMDVRFRKFQRGRTIRTIGMTHVRFNRAGQVILHQDYWDSAQGLFEYVPVIGGGIRLIKSRL